MGRQKFMDEVAALGHAPENLGDGRICFGFHVSVGPRAGRDVRLGFVIGEDYPLNPPGGPHFSPLLMPMNPTGGAHPHAGIHPSPFGDGWQYWSRPMHHWARTGRRASDVLAHVHQLLATLPE